MIFFLLLGLLGLTGCTAMPGMAGHVSSHQSDFDGSTQVSMEPAKVKTGALSVVLIGADWSSKSPDRVMLTAVVPGDYERIISDEGLQFNIDGDIVKLSSDQAITDLDGEYAGGMVFRESAKTFPVKISLVERIVKADLVKIKLVTGDGYVEGRFQESDPNNAKDAIERFLAEIEEL
ncbi:hypothetical protein [Chromohalobacter sp. 48-RD10]|uniref:hypothetical protein n=1 Tax=Chromohalobacter sp. 48-RD10 TaxID=2994063 RepID=UPI002469B5E1|nr:hypothetical protein [Chromohalobacter sp. 48-RD10]